jgi:hypothetical protein
MKENVERLRCFCHGNFSARWGTWPNALFMKWFLPVTRSRESGSLGEGIATAMI